MKEWVKGLEFPVLFHRQVFTNKDGSTGTLYLISNDLNATTTPLERIYQKRWKVEAFHKSIKSKLYINAIRQAFDELQKLKLFMSLLLD